MYASLQTRICCICKICFLWLPLRTILSWLIMLDVHYPPVFIMLASNHVLAIIIYGHCKICLWLNPIWVGISRVNSVWPIFIFAWLFHYKHWWPWLISGPHLTFIFLLGPCVKPAWSLEPQILFTLFYPTCTTSSCLSDVHWPLTVGRGCVGQYTKPSNNPTRWFRLTLLKDDVAIEVDSWCIALATNQPTRFCTKSQTDPISLHSLPFTMT